MPDTTPTPEVSRYHSMTDRALADELALIANANKHNKAVAEEVNAEIERRYGPSLADLAKKSNSGTGTFSILAGFGDGKCTAKREIKADVKYDSPALLKVMADMQWDQIQALFKIEVSVPAKSYGGLAANPDLKAKIDAARTVTPKPQPIKLVFADDPAA